jgi:phthiocerol/phenolphthiocerol synthesis type-I polyketide synthase E
MALAGGVSLRRDCSYHVVEGGIWSPDGVCRPFDEQANGTVFGQGGALILLQPLDQARTEGRRVYASIVGTSVNNDGNRKPGYSAPSVSGQAQAISRLLADVPGGAASVRMVEAHGTGTRLGDPIEVKALSQAFGLSALHRGSCLLGSVKANLGHLDVAAGVAGVVKAALSAYHGQVPPAINIRTLNPLLNLEETPFDIPTAAQPWQAYEAGAGHAVVCSLGFGGTNAYLALAPCVGRASVEAEPQAPVRAVPISARTAAAAQASQGHWLGYLAQNPCASIGRVARTARTGRATFEERRALLLQHDGPPEILRHEAGGSERRQIVFSFTGQGSRFSDSCARLVQSLPALGHHVTKCTRYFHKMHGIDVNSLLVASASVEARHDTRQVQAALFTIEYSVATTLMGWGVKPHAVVGHSIGELVGLCIAGAMTLPQAMDLVQLRGHLMHQAGPGAMLAVRMALDQWRALGRPDVDVAAVNGPMAIVLAGSDRVIDQLACDLAELGVVSQRLETEHAFHSRLMTGAAKEFAAVASSMPFAEPNIDVWSCVLGRQMTTGDLASTAYWQRSVDGPVYFHDAVIGSARNADSLFLEVGPDATLTRLTRRILTPLGKQSGHVCVAASGERSDEPPQLLERCVAWAWMFGGDVAWDLVEPACAREPQSMPLYPFQRRHFGASGVMHGESAATPGSSPRPMLAPQQVADGGDRVVDGVSAVFSRVLGVAVNDKAASMFDLGGDSLASIAIVRGIAEAYPPSLTMAQFLAAPSVEGIVLLLSQRQGTASMGTAKQAGHTSRPHLPDDVLPVQESDMGPCAARVLVTGGTGFVGAHLIADLLDHTDRRVVCLVRGVKGGRERPIEATLRRYKRWKDEWGQRLETVQGDLEAPCLGLRPTDWLRLAREVDSIFHLGASVNHVYPLSQLYAANVQSCVELLRLCAIGHTKSLHFASTMAVFNASSSSVEEPLQENFELPRVPSDEDGYASSKAAAEFLLKQAHERGLPVVVHRLPTVTGHSVHGLCNHRDWIWAIVKTMVMLRAIPPDWADRSSHAHQLAPVDGVTAAMLSIWRNPQAVGGCCHLMPREHVEMSEFTAALRRAGFRLESVTAAEWKRRVDIGRRLPGTESFLWSVRTDGSLDLLPRHTYTIDALSRCASEVSRPSTGSLDCYVQRLIEEGFLPHPADPALIPQPQELSVRTETIT